MNVRHLDWRGVCPMKDSSASRRPIMAPSHVGVSRAFDKGLNMFNLAAVNQEAVARQSLAEWAQEMVSGFRRPWNDVER
jgi:hypothetical protein